MGTPLRFNPLRSVLGLSLGLGAAGLVGACAFGGPTIGDGRSPGGMWSGDSPIAMPSGPYYDEEYESAQGTLLMLSDTGEGGELVGEIGAVSGIDHVSTVDVAAFGGSARVTMTVERTGRGPAMAILNFEGDLRALVARGETTVDGGGAEEEFDASVVGCWTPGWARETTAQDVHVVAVADPVSQTIDLTFDATFPRGDGAVTGHLVLAYAEVDADEVYAGWFW